MNLGELKAIVDTWVNEDFVFECQSFMNLGELKAIVDTWVNEDFVFECQSFMNPHSYRGYYNELAFEYCDCPLNVADIKRFVCEAGTDTFTGWKGGEYTYDDNTPVHLSRQGDANDEEGYDFIELVFAMDREYRSFNSNPCYNTPMETKTEIKMATKRKTAAEKRAEAEALRGQEQQEEDANFRATYQTRPLKLVYAYVSELSASLETTGEDDYEAFEFRTSRYNNVRLPMSPDSDLRSVYHLREDMEEAEHFLEVNREALRVERERAAKKTAALAKLTKEERELLGL